MKKTFDIIVAYDKNKGIGLKNTLPWNFAEDMKWFEMITTRVEWPNQQNIVISMNSIPLKNRINIIVSKTLISDHIICPNFEDALKYAFAMENIYNIFVIGGEKIYKEACNNKHLKYIYATEIDNNYNCDTFFPTIENLKIINSQNFQFYKIIKYELYCNTEEMEYLNLLKEIINYGDLRQTRNAKTLSLFGKKMEFNLSNGFPLITTKKVFLRGVFEELKFFLMGQTDANILSDKGVHIWDDNTSQEFIDKMGLPYKKGDMGELYGFQFRHFGAKYIDKNTDYTGQGFDQIEYIINKLRTDPTSRRITMTSYNPIDAQKSVLPPCHGISIQFYVESNNKLTCAMTQRSCDVFCGLPFNIASYALFVHIICWILPHLSPGRLIMYLNDVHLYEDHIDAAKLQIDRIPFKFPQLEIKSKSELKDLNWEDIILTNYNHHAVIKVKMVA
jgi:thymidylate synthase/dihydrofolate reductase